MIALCRKHADAADGGAFTNDQLRAMKAMGVDAASAIEGRFLWMRRKWLARVAGTFFYDVPQIICVGMHPLIWFDRNELGDLTLSFDVPSLTGEPRAKMRANEWEVPPDVNELECPPQGRRLEVRYANGDRFRVEFKDINSGAEFQSRYRTTARPGGVDAVLETVPFPVTLVELSATADGAPIQLSPEKIEIGGSVETGGILLRGGLVWNSSPGIQVNLPPGYGDELLSKQIHDSKGIEFNLPPWFMTDSFQRFLDVLARDHDEYETTQVAHRLNLVDLPRAGGRFATIAGHEFEDCLLRGDVHVYLPGEGSLIDCGFASTSSESADDIDSFIQTVGDSIAPPPNTVVLASCDFRRCEFEVAGIVADSHVAERVRTELRKAQEEAAANQRVPEIASVAQVLNLEVSEQFAVADEQLSVRCRVCGLTQSLADAVKKQPNRTHIAYECLAGCGMLVEVVPVAEAPTDYGYPTHGWTILGTSELVFRVSDQGALRMWIGPRRTDLSKWVDHPGLPLHPPHV